MALPRVPGKTTTTFGFSYIERSLKDCLAKRQFGKDETEKAVQFFRRWEGNLCCVFYGAPDVKRWDHLVPVVEALFTVETQGRQGH
jgi:hypothetical protein